MVGAQHYIQKKEKCKLESYNFTSANLRNSCTDIIRYEVGINQIWAYIAICRLIATGGHSVWLLEEVGKQNWTCTMENFQRKCMTL
jgi:hypothetical protein